MAVATEQARTFNVWLVTSNTVYKGVPYTVICDWIVEGRITPRDCVRTPTDANWTFLNEHQLFQPYFDAPANQPKRAEDVSEALEPLEMDFQPRKKQEHEEEDPDMIPLIDISMVLLVFFMMTAQDLLSASPIESPQAAHAHIIDAAKSITVNMKADPDRKDRIIYYYHEDFNTELTEEGLIEKVKDMMRERGADPPKIIVSAQDKLPFEKVQHLTIAIEKLGVQTLQARVREKPGGEGGTEP